MQWYAPQVSVLELPAVFLRFTHVSSSTQAFKAEEEVAIDASALSRFILKRVNEAYMSAECVARVALRAPKYTLAHDESPARRPQIQSIQHAGYSSSAPGGTKVPVHRNVSTALQEAGVLMRDFKVDTDGPVLAPAIALTSDLFHTAFQPELALAGTSKADPAPALILVSGSASYAPAVARLAQAGRDVFVAATAQDVSRLHAVLPPAARSHILPIHLDDVFPELLQPLALLKEKGPLLQAAMWRLHQELLCAGGKVPSSELHSHLTAAGLRPFMSARKCGARQLVELFPEYFALRQEGAGTYTVQAKASAKAPTVEPVSPKTTGLAGLAAAGAGAPAGGAKTAAPPAPAAKPPAAKPPAAKPAAEQVDVEDAAPAKRVSPERVADALNLAREQGLMQEAGVNRRSLYKLMSVCGVPDVKSRMSRAELDNLLAEHFELVEKQLERSA